MFALLSGPDCSKLTTSTVNVSLKFHTLISEICQYFAKASVIFSTKNITAFGYKVVKHIMSCPLNKLVKLKMLLTTWPRFLAHLYRDSTETESSKTRILSYIDTFGQTIFVSLS